MIINDLLVHFTIDGKQARQGNCIKAFSLLSSRLQCLGSLARFLLSMTFDFCTTMISQPQTKKIFLTSVRVFGSFASCTGVFQSTFCFLHFLDGKEENPRNIGGRWDIAELVEAMSCCNLFLRPGGAEKCASCLLIFALPCLL